MNKLTKSTSVRRRLSKAGLTLVTIITGLFVLFATPDTASAGGGCSSPDGICEAKIELFIA